MPQNDHFEYDSASIDEQIFNMFHSDPVRLNDIIEFQKKLAQDFDSNTWTQAEADANLKTFVDLQVLQSYKSYVEDAANPYSLRSAAFKKAAGESYEAVEARRQAQVYKESVASVLAQQVKNQGMSEDALISAWKNVLKSNGPKHVWGDCNQHDQGLNGPS